LSFVELSRARQVFGVIGKNADGKKQPSNGAPDKKFQNSPRPGSLFFAFLKGFFGVVDEVFHLIVLRNGQVGIFYFLYTFI